ncbi:hypothetical protein B0H17DRAFT_1204078 [Mycena rosella]|uniref:Nucleoside 2-deoxyribosyltransferase n=1 Tax=Mycena rosella TaxID=1033263 RepID=A0AAD7DAE3_MYCRO|nr:hypothetical protein B0H17DRAFT_1204078 [Mycena rosella]
MANTPSKARIYKPPQKVQLSGRSVFLAGSIEMGVAEDWQTALTERVSHLPITVLNPRRDDWDSSWKQTAADPQFRAQVEWELEQQERCDVIAMYFDPNTKAPISLLELGLFAASGKMVVCCPDGFYRKGNVEIVCERAKIPLVHTLDQLIDKVIERLTVTEA